MDEKFIRFEETGSKRRIAINSKDIRSIFVSDSLISFIEDGSLTEYQIFPENDFECHVLETILTHKITPFEDPSFNAALRECRNHKIIDVQNIDEFDDVVIVIQINILPKAIR